jgi:hypothetical protein
VAEPLVSRFTLSYVYVAVCPQQLLALSRYHSPITFKLSVVPLGGVVVRVGQDVGGVQVLLK